MANFQGHYSRADSALLLDISGSQFDYLVKQLGIKSIKIGRDPIYGFNQLLKFKLALYLKSLKYPIDVIRATVSYTDFDEDNRLFDKYSNIQIPSYILLVSGDSSNKKNLEGLESVGKDRITKHELGHYIYLVINQEEVDTLKDEILEKIKSGSYVSTKAVISDSYKELKIIGEKHNISIPDVA